MAMGPRPRVDRDGVRVVPLERPGRERRRAGAAIAAAVLAVVVLAWMTMRDGSRMPTRAQEPARVGVAAPAPSAAASGPVPASRPADLAPAAAAPPGAHPTRRRAAREARAAAAAPQQEVTLGDVAPYLDHTQGIGLFPLPGTDPPRSGIVVPDDFELPEGYVRHYQSTDDGQALPPILMFHPDYDWVDAEGQPIPLPADRVVPPALAPRGLPIHMLEVPGATGSRGPDR